MTVSLDNLTVKAGLAGVHPHILRQSTTAALLAAGEPLPLVSKILGHGSAVVTATIYSMSCRPAGCRGHAGSSL